MWGKKLHSVEYLRDIPSLSPVFTVPLTSFLSLHSLSILVFLDCQLHQLNSGRPVHCLYFPSLHCSLETANNKLGIPRTHICVQSLRDHCPSLIYVQFLECYFFMYFVWWFSCFKIYLIPVTPFLTKAEILLTFYPVVLISINDHCINQLFHWGLVV